MWTQRLATPALGRSNVRLRCGRRRKRGAKRRAQQADRLHQARVRMRLRPESPLSRRSNASYGVRVTVAAPEQPRSAEIPVEDRRWANPLACIAGCYTLVEELTMTAQARPRRTSSAANKSANLMVRVDRSSKAVITRAARIRGVSASDYVRSVVVAQARREVDEARTRTIVLTADEQLAFWKALEQSVSLTPRQRELGRIMRGER